jgi:hypothetical protein
MKRQLALALISLAFAGGATQSEAGGCCVDVPKACYPILRIPVENYVYNPAVFYPPDHPIPYSTWYYSLYEPFCAGKPAASCIWACGPVPPIRGVAVKAGY